MAGPYNSDGNRVKIYKQTYLRNRAAEGSKAPTSFRERYWLQQVERMYLKNSKNTKIKLFAEGGNEPISIFFKITQECYKVGV